MNASMVNKILKITLVNPPFKYFPGMAGSKESYTRPPLGIAYLAAYLIKYMGGKVEVRLIDCEAENYEGVEEAFEEIISDNPDLVGFSVVTGTVHAASQLAKSIKETNPGIKVVAGGPHITALPDEYISGIDVNMYGESEISLHEYIENRILRDGSEPILGCVEFDKDGNVAGRGDPRPFIEDLDSIPIPSRELLRDNAYFHSYPYVRNSKFTTMFTARGCPYNCNFCGNEVIWGRRVRYHSLERTFKEIDRIVEQGYNLLFIDDDTFTAKKTRAMEICRYIRDNHPTLKWICHARADTLDREMLLEMKRAGCVEMQIGVESGDAEILKNTDKSLNIGRVRKTFDLIREVKINSWATFIIGNAGETPETIVESIRFAKEIDPTYCSFIILLPFPGTRIFDQYKQLGCISTYDWSKYSWHGKPVIDLDLLPTRELVKWRRRAYLKFYLRPRKIIQTALNVLRAMSLREIKRSMHAWKAIVSQR
jgi:anaerobic magnesium-protoporphyrin IX monomethyl ester cyclase